MGVGYMEEKIIQKLALERCRLYLSQITALCHLHEDQMMIGELVSYMNQDFSLIEDLITPE